MPTKVAPKTRQQKIEERWQELDAIQQMEAYHAAEEAERQKARVEFEARAQAGHDRIASYVRHSFAQRANDSMTGAQLNALRGQIEQEAFEQVRPTIPTINQIYAEQAEAERLAAEEAERQRIAALTPKDIWMSTLSWSERSHITKWERINRQDWPYAP